MNNNVTEAFYQMRNKQRMNIMRAFGANIEKSEDIDVEKSEDDDFDDDERQEVIKALSSKNPFERAYGMELLEKSDMSDIEKSDILNAISYNGNIKITKSGKELKEQIKNVILPAQNAELATAKAKADSLLTECGQAPTGEICPWWTGQIKMNVEYKIYPWNECCMNCSDGVSDSLSLSHQEEKSAEINTPQTKDECVARNKYNETVQKICNILVDIKTCEILVKNLKDEETIELTPQQVLVFKFD